MPGSSLPALLRRFPELASKLPWRRLGDWPTPVRQLPDLGRQLGIAELWVKDDGLSGLTCGGNKVRKLEPLLAEAQQQGCRSLVTVGGIGSNHLVTTACYGRELGLPTHGVIFPQPLTPQVRQTVQLLRALEVELWPCASRLQVPLTLRRARRAAEQPYLIGPGGSSPLGSLGYVSAGLELAAQVQAGELPAPELIVVALGSGGTTAGLLLGLELGGLGSRVLAVRVVERVLCNRPLLRWLLGRTARLLGRLGVSVSAAAAARRLRIVHGQLGGAYGLPTPAACAAVERAGSAGLQLETTYTGKAFAGLGHLAAGGSFKNTRILFWNTHNARDLAGLATREGSRPLPALVARWVNGSS